MREASRRAYDAIRPYLGVLQHEVLEMIRARGAYGLTSDEAEQLQSDADASRIFRRSTVTSRFSELKRMGLIRDMWDVGLRRETRSGQSAAVCVAIEHLPEAEQDALLAMTLDFAADRERRRRRPVRTAIPRRTPIPREDWQPQLSEGV